MYAVEKSPYPPRRSWCIWEAAESLTGLNTESTQCQELARLPRPEKLGVLEPAQKPDNELLLRSTVRLLSLCQFNGATNPRPDGRWLTALSPVVQDLTCSVPNVILLIDGADGTQLHPCFAQYPMLRHHIPTQVATPRCWPVRMPGLEPLSASRFVQPLLLTVARRTHTLTTHMARSIPLIRTKKVQALLAAVLL